MRAAGSEVEAVGASEVASARARAYFGLASGFAPPDHPAFAGAATLDLRELATTVRRTGMPAPSPLSRALPPAEALPEDPRDLATEYARLFVVPGAGLVHPFESAHREGRAMGESAMCVLKDFAAAGLAPSPGFAEPPDHICAELEFMLHLADVETEARKTGDDANAQAAAQRSRMFLDEHLSRWAPGFAKRILATAPHQFYRRLALSLDAMVSSDLMILEVASRGGRA